MSITLDAGLNYVVLVRDVRTVRQAREAVAGSWPLFSREGRDANTVRRKHGRPVTTTIIAAKAFQRPL